MNITYTSSHITNPVLANLRQWVINCQDHIQEDDGVINDMEELARLLEFWRSKYLTAEAEQIQILIFSSESILIKDDIWGEFIQVDKVKEVNHA